MPCPCHSGGENVEGHKYFKGVPQSREELQILVLLSYASACVFESVQMEECMLGSFTFVSGWIVKVSLFHFSPNTTIHSTSYCPEVPLHFVALCCSVLPACFLYSALQHPVSVVIGAMNF